MIDLDGMCLNCMQYGMVSGVCKHCQTPEGFHQDAPEALPPGTILHGQYLLGRMLGRGGFGITYIALDLRSNERVAIKEYMPQRFACRSVGKTHVQNAASETDFLFGRDRFLQEAQTIYALRDCESIIHVLKLFSENNTAYFAMEFLDGENLKQMLAKRRKPLSAGEAIKLLRPVFDALCFVHARQVVHRDVSPDNIFICKDGRIKLIDFGAAYASLKEKSSEIDMVAKRGYSPFEQYINNSYVGPWSDVYALAATMYCSMTGTPPPESTQRNYRDELVQPSQMGVEISAAQERALLKALAVRREDRYRSVEAFRNAFFAAEGVAAVPEPSSDTGSWIRRWREFTQGARGERRRAKTRLAIRCVAGVFAGSVFEIGETPVLLGMDTHCCNIVFPPGTPGMEQIHCALRADMAEKTICLKDYGFQHGIQLISTETFRNDGEAALRVGDGFIIGEEVFTVVLE